MHVNMAAANISPIGQMVFCHGATFKGQSNTTSPHGCNIIQQSSVGSSTCAAWQPAHTQGHEYHSQHQSGNRPSNAFDPWKPLDINAGICTKYDYSMGRTRVTVMVIQHLVHHEQMEIVEQTDS